MNDKVELLCMAEDGSLHVFPGRLGFIGKWYVQPNWVAGGASFGVESVIYEVLDYWETI